MLPIGKIAALKLVVHLIGAEAHEGRALINQSPGSSNPENHRGIDKIHRTLRLQPL